MATLVKGKWGFMKMRCRHCKAAQSISLFELYNAWRVSYDKINKGGVEKKTRRFTANIKCFCGQTSQHNSPMFDHIFRLIFEAISEEKSKE